MKIFFVSLSLTEAKNLFELKIVSMGLSNTDIKSSDQIAPKYLCCICLKRV